MTKFSVDARVTLLVLRDQIFCTSDLDVGRAPPDKPCRQSHFSFLRALCKYSGGQDLFLTCADRVSCLQEAPHKRSPFMEGKGLTEGLPLALRRKLAVWAAAGGWLGIGRWPSAMPTIAVM